MLKFNLKKRVVQFDKEFDAAPALAWDETVQAVVFPKLKICSAMIEEIKPVIRRKPELQPVFTAMGPSSRPATGWYRRTLLFIEDHKTIVAILAVCVTLLGVSQKEWLSRHLVFFIPVPPQSVSQVASQVPPVTIRLAKGTTDTQAIILDPTLRASHRIG